MRTLLVRAWLASMIACASTSPKPFQFGPSTVTPAATGEVTAAMGPNGNTTLAIDVKHLAPPDRVTPGATVYVVWATELAPGTGVHNLGALRVDANLDGKLDSLTALGAFDLTITPEATQGVDTPSGKAVLSVRIAPRS